MPKMVGFPGSGGDISEHIFIDDALGRPFHLPLDLCTKMDVSSAAPMAGPGNSFLIVRYRYFKRLWRLNSEVFLVKVELPGATIF